jgi:hypothetical protein
LPHYSAVERFTEQLLVRCVEVVEVELQATGGAAADLHGREVAVVLVLRQD